MSEAVAGAPTVQRGYTPIFDPPPVPIDPAPAAGGSGIGDRADPWLYVFDEPLILAVNIALATGRPLLLYGRPGTGKSSVAASVAFHLSRRFYALTITSRTQAQDLLWTVDDVERLSDATGGGGAGPREQYRTPGPLWWAFDPESAARRGIPVHRLGSATLLRDPNRGTGGAGAQAVILLDEIDKADPDVPNDLLEPLGRYEFSIGGPEEEVVTAETEPLVIITTNEERDLPRALLRRCVAHTLPLPTRTRLRQIAQSRFGTTDTALYDEIARALPVAAAEPGITPPAEPDEQRVDVSVAEYIDMVRAARRLSTRPGTVTWGDVIAATTMSSGTAAGTARR